MENDELFENFETGALPCNMLLIWIIEMIN